MKHCLLFLLLLCVANVAVARKTKSNKDGQQSMAVGAMRSINTAEKWYAKTYTQEGYACKMDTLGSGKTSTASAAHARLLDSSLTNGTVRDGYLFQLSCADSSKPSQHYRSAAIPVDKSMAAFCSDESGTIRSIAGKDAASCLEKGQNIQNLTK